MAQEKKEYGHIDVGDIIKVGTELKTELGTNWINCRQAMPVKMTRVKISWQRRNKLAESPNVSRVTLNVGMSCKKSCNSACK